MRCARRSCTAILLGALVLGTAAGAVLPRAGADPAPEVPTPSVARGRTVYEKNCVTCHRHDGTGGVRVLASGAAARDFTRPDFWRGRSDAQLARAIEAGFPRSGMVSWRTILSARDIRDVAAYLRAAFQPRERAAGRAPVAR